MIRLIRYIFIPALVLSCVEVVAQESPIALPASPAFSIMDFEPASVMRPGNPKDLATDILNSFDKDGKLLMNLGLEVSPFWLKPRPLLDRKTYLEAKGFQSLLQTLSISAATVKDTASGGNKFGVGFRFKLYNGNVSEEYKQSEKKLIGNQLISAAISAGRAIISPTATRDTLIDFITGVLRDTVFINASLDSREVDKSDTVAIKDVGSSAAENFVAMANQYKPKFNDTENGLRIFIDTLSNVFSRTYDDVKTDVATLARQRFGFVLEFAGASSFKSTDNNFEKAGLWVTVSNVVSANDSYNMSFRYFFSTGDTSSNNADLGISYVKQTSRFSISVEGMARYYRAEMVIPGGNNELITKVDDKFTYRLAVQTAYKIARDISINISIGKDFDDPFITGGGFFSIFGASYSLFKPFEK